MENYKLGKWITDELPIDMHPVIAKFEGQWPGSDNSHGYADLYTYDGTWFNVPETVKIVAWMHSVPCIYIDSETTIDVDENLIGEWIDANTKPANGIMVIAIFSGFHRFRGNSGITEAQCKNGEWIGLPPGVKIEKWMYDPETYR